MAVSTTSSNKNHVMIQNDSGLLANQPRNPRVVWGGVCAASSMNAATMRVGTSATQTSNTARKIQNSTTTMPKIRRRLVLSCSHNPCDSTIDWKNVMKRQSENT